MSPKQRLRPRDLIQAIKAISRDTYFETNPDNTRVVEDNFAEGYRRGVKSVCGSLRFKIIYKGDNLSHKDILEFLRHREGLVTDDVG